MAKQGVYAALADAIRRASVKFYALPDGMAVRISSNRCYEPDALVAPLPVPTRDALEIDSPVIVAEVLSTWSIRRDLTAKVDGYAKVPTIEHYIVVDPEERLVMHFRRKGDVLLPPEEPLTEGTLRLDPPGLEVPVSDMLGPAPEAA